MSRTVALFNETGTVNKRNYPVSHSEKHRKLTDVDKLLIIEFTVDNPGVFFHEIQRCLLEEHGTEVSISTFCKFLHKEAGFTRQKMILTDKQRDESLRMEYLMDISIYMGHPEFFVFIDETGSDSRDRQRKFGYSLRGRPAVCSSCCLEAYVFQLLPLFHMIMDC